MHLPQIALQVSPVSSIVINSTFSTVPEMPGLIPGQALVSPTQPTEDATQHVLVPVSSETTRFA
jgi:hypothetical protein